MQEQLIHSLNPAAISAIFVAIVLAASRLAPFTRPYWTFFPKIVQAWLPSVVAGLPVALNAFGAVKTWLDLVQAALTVGVIAIPFAVPGISSPHNHPLPPPPDATAKPPSPPPELSLVSSGDRPTPVDPGLPPPAA